MSTPRKMTTLMELVETHNLYLSLRRLHNAQNYDSRRWKRALLHALQLSGCGDVLLTKMREAMELP